jgi:hypothetical protein
MERHLIESWEKYIKKNASANTYTVFCVFQGHMKLNPVDVDVTSPLTPKLTIGQVLSCRI